MDHLALPVFYGSSECHHMHQNPDVPAARDPAPDTAHVNVPSHLYSAPAGPHHLLHLHQHDHSASHDDSCIPARSLLPPETTGHMSQFYNNNNNDNSSSNNSSSSNNNSFGTAPMSRRHHEEYASHDDSCLLGNGCLGLGLDAAGLVQFPSSSAFDFFPHDLEPQHISPLPLMSPVTPSLFPEQQQQHQQDLSEDARSNADSRSSCGSQCPGSEGPCSAGTCDEATACRDENCSMPYVPPEIAHSAFILQAMNSARLQQASESQRLSGTESGFAQQAPAHPAQPNINYGQFHPGQPQTYHQEPQTPYTNHFSRHVSVDLSQSQNLDASQYQCPFPGHDHFLNAQAFALLQQSGPDFEGFDCFSNMDLHSQDAFAATGQIHIHKEPLMTGLVVNSPDLTDQMMSGYPTGTEASDLAPSGSQPQTRSSSQSQRSSLTQDSFPPPTPTLSRLSSMSEHRMTEPEASAEAHICHWMTSHGEEICGQTFLNASSLSAHVNSAHIDDLDKTQHGFECRWKDCPRLKRVSSESEFAFQQKSKMKRHMEIHTGGKDYKCQVCSRMFSNQQSLKQHILIHKGEKPYKCPWDGCGKWFRQKSALTMHIRTHTREKPLECRECGKAFSESSALSKHMRTHSHVRPFTCPVCGRGFTRRDQMRRHASTAHPARPDKDAVVVCAA